MKLIIAGGRDYILTERDYCKLTRIDGVTEVVSGCAKGADKCGEIWAAAWDLPIARFPADWNAYGKRAGFLLARLGTCN